MLIMGWAFSHVSASTLGQPQAFFQVGVGSPLGLHVSQQTKDKIWQSAFVDFSLLCSNTTLTSAMIDKAKPATADLSLVVEKRALVLRKPGVTRKKIESLDVWQSAFHTFMAIFLEKHPLRSAELLKYAEIVRLAANQFPGFGWRLYDERFRLKQELIPTQSWGNLYMELWLTVVAAGVTSPIVMGSNVPSTLWQGNKPKVANKGRVCFAYNNGSGCFTRLCKYMHHCSKCFSSGHGAYQCRLGQVGGQPKGANQAMVSSPWAAQPKPRAPSTKAANNVLNNVHKPFGPNSRSPTRPAMVLKGDNIHSGGGGYSSLHTSNAN